MLLESVKVKGKYLFVGNTHLYFHPDADHIRLIQAASCMRLIEALIAEKFPGVSLFSLPILAFAHFRLAETPCRWQHLCATMSHFSIIFLFQILQPDVCVMFCGDMNSVPENAVYQLATQQFVPAFHEDWRSS